jgi:hypothetical protein
VQWCRLCYSLGLYLPVCWCDGNFFVVLRFSLISFLLVCLLLFLSRGVVCFGLLVEFLRVQVLSSCGQPTSGGPPA